MSYSLPSGILSYCSGNWNASINNFEKGDPVKCCLDSCLQQVKYCSNRCNSSNCDKCNILIDNCKSGCLEGVKNKNLYSDINYNLNFKYPTKKSSNKIILIIIFFIIVIIIIIIKMKKYV
jgi:hypothetical protein